jgi:hypothetical protein
MAAQSALGLTFSGQYRDAAWITATWFGNDLITLVVAVPALAAAVALSQRGSIRGHLAWCGLLAYATYNYAFYLVGAALNVFFPMYAASFVLAASALILAFARGPGSGHARGGPAPSRMARAIAGFLILVGCGLSVVWLGLWALYVFAGLPTPIEPEAFKVVAALDLSLMVPALIAGGVLLWRGNPWGRLVATMTSVQAALYLLVLTVNSVVAISRGLAKFPGELPIWGPLAIGAALAAASLLVSAGSAPRRTLERSV